LQIDGSIRWLHAPVSALLKAAEDVLGEDKVHLGYRKLSIPVAAILLAGIGSTLFLAYNAVRPNFAPGDGPAKDMCATPIHSAPVGMHQFR